MGVGNRVAKATRAATDKPEIISGTVVAVDGDTQTATLNVLGGRVTAQYFGSHPQLGRGVFVLIAGSYAVVLGTPAGPALGTIADAGDGTFVTVTGDDGVTYSLYYSQQYDPVIGDRVLLGWDGGGHVIIPISGNPAPPLYPNLPEPPVPLVVKEQTFYPTDSASFNGAWSTTDVVLAAPYTSAGWFYGRQFADTIPFGAVIDRVTIYIEAAPSADPIVPVLGLHSALTRPVGGLSIATPANLGQFDREHAGPVELPPEFGDSLRSGFYFGIGSDGTGVGALRGVPQGSAQGAVTIRWRE